MAQQIVQIACDALALRLLGETFDLGIGTLQKSIGSCQLGEGKVTEPKDQAVEKHVFRCGKRVAEITGLRCDAGHRRQEHQKHGAQTSEEKAKHGERVDKHYVGVLVERVIEKGDQKEQHKRHGLPAPCKLRDQKVKNEESRVKNREFHPD